MDLTLYRTHTKALIIQKSLDQLLQGLPTSLHPRALRYKSEQSAYNFVVGRLLLKQGLEYFGLENRLDKIEFQENGKPLTSGLHFNISHSADQVVCAFSKDAQLGIDLELITQIEFDDFRTMFSSQEWASINTSDDPLRSFYWFWTRKESIIKALGLNLSHLHQIELDVSLDHFSMSGKPWFLRTLDLGPEYASAICTEKKITELKLIDSSF